MSTSYEDSLFVKVQYKLFAKHHQIALSTKLRKVIYDASKVSMLLIDMAHYVRPLESMRTAVSSKVKDYYDQV